MERKFSHNMVLGLVWIQYLFLAELLPPRAFSLTGYKICGASDPRSSSQRVHTSICTYHLQTQAFLLQQLHLQAPSLKNLCSESPPFLQSYYTIVSTLLRTSTPHFSRNGLGHGLGHGFGHGFGHGRDVRLRCSL